MATPVLTQILDAIEARLKLVKTANGYSQSILSGSVRRKNRTVWSSSQDLPATSYWLESDSRVEGMAGWEQRTALVGIEAYGSDYDADLPDTANALAADIQIALQRDPDSPAVTDPADLNFGSSVSQVYVETMLPIAYEGERPLAGCTMELAVTYCLDPTDPYTLIP